jgi:hypothetical protein
MNTPEIREAYAEFETGCEFSGAAKFAGGLINSSWLVTTAGAAGNRFLLQQLNTAVFARPVEVMQNIAEVTDHLGRGSTPEPTLDFCRVNPPGAYGSYLWRDDSGAYWRMCRFIEDTRTVVRLTGPDDAQTAGQAYGRFLRKLADFPADQLKNILPGFHDTPARWKACQAAWKHDIHDRAAGAEAEFAYLSARADLATGLTSLDLPLRAVHNDAKLANVLLDAHGGQAVCVVDLDTVMSGTALHDFGDMMRTMCSFADEEEMDLDNVHVEPELFAALTRGYLSEAASVLTPMEKDHLVTAGLVITFEQALRFLTDYLQGDVYYQTNRAEHNLDRCRNQLRLLDSILEQRVALKALAV